MCLCPTLLPVSCIGHCWKERTITLPLVSDYWATGRVCVCGGGGGGGGMVIIRGIEELGRILIN